MVKALKGKMMMVDVAEEQAHQMKVAARKAQMLKEIDRHWEEVEAEKMKEYDAKMRAKLEAEYSIRQKNAKDISDQLETFKLDYIKKIKEEMLEGELIKRQVEEDLEREKQREIEKQKRIAQMRLDLIEANKEQLKLREAARLKELEEDKKIEKDARKFLEIGEMKKTKEEQRFKEKLETRQKMIDRQIEELRALHDNQEEVLNRQVAEAEDKANQLYAEKEQRKIEMKAAIERSRALQIQRRQRERNAERQEE